MSRFLQLSALSWQFLLVLVELLLITASVYAAVMLRFWGHAGTQTAFEQE
jgi:hypothetical protein